MKIKYLLLIAFSYSMFLLQGCIKEKNNVVPEATTSHNEEHWNYEHPESWGAVGNDCDGIIQSPIDINTFGTLKTSLPDLIFNHTAFPISVLDNGHTIQINTNDNDVVNHVTFNGKKYLLKQLHFHAKSEHTINGSHTPMELHMVHINSDGEILVVGLMIEEGATDHPFISKLWNNLPTQKKQEELKSTNIDMSDILPIGTGYYNYIGSLTTPPCSMGLQWIVMKESIKLSAAQINVFKSMYDHNYRPTQKLNNRVVFEKV